MANSRKLWWTFSIIVVASTLFLRPTDANLRVKRQEDGGAPAEATVDSDAAVTVVETDPVPSAEGEITAPDDWITDSIKRINEIRSNHEACPLSLDKNLCAPAQARANEILASGEVTAVENSGENVYAAKNTNEFLPQPKDAPDTWYEERSRYDYAAGKPKLEGDTTNFFTQLVWKEATHICVTYAKAKQVDENGEYLLVVVAKFSPIGNMAGQFVDNVRPEAAVSSEPAAKIANAKCPTYPARASSVWLENLLQAHNMLRHLHGSPSLILSKDLSEIAQGWVNKMADTNHFEHNSDCNGAAELGENLYYSSMGEPNNEPANGTRAVVAWYEEIANYDYETTHSKNDKEILHFTQLVWKESREMGAAYATSKKPNSRGFYSTYVVVNYYPRGNFGDFLVNVKPPMCKNVNYADIGLPISTEAGGGDAPSEPGKNSTVLACLNGVLNVFVWVTVSYYVLLLVDSLP